MPRRDDTKMIGVSTETHAILKARSLSRPLSRQTMDDVIQELLLIADKFDKVAHRGKYRKEGK